MCDRLGISVWEVIEAAATKPFGFLAHCPGPGLGGDCIPVVPHFLAWRLREYGYSAQLIDAAHEVNSHMPNFVLQKVGDALNDVGPPSRARASCCWACPTRPTSRTCASRRASRSSSASLPAAATSATATRTSRRSTSTASRTRASSGGRGGRDADCVVMLTQHREFLETPRWEQAKLVVDTRNVVPAGPHVHPL